MAFILKNTLHIILNKHIYDPINFINYFCSKNNNFKKGKEYSSQDFILTLLINIKNSKGLGIISQNKGYEPSNIVEKDEYNKFLLLNNIFPETNAVSLFSGMTKSHSKGVFPLWKKYIEKYSFNYFLDIKIPKIKHNFKYYITDFIKENLGSFNFKVMNCPICYHELKIKEETKIIKLPDILIFTKENFQDVIQPVEIINMGEFIDYSLKTNESKYELFAINKSFKNDNYEQHVICEAKRFNKWYAFNDNNFHRIGIINHFKNFDGLFYKKISN